MPRPGDSESKKKAEPPLQRQASITFDQLSEEEQKEQLAIDAITAKIAEIHTGIARIRTDFEQETPFDALFKRLGLALTFINKGELKKQINKIKKLTDDKELGERLTALEKSIEGSEKEGRPGIKFVDIDEISRNAKLLSNSVIKYLKVEIPSESARTKPKF